MVSTYAKDIAERIWTERTPEGGSLAAHAELCRRLRSLMTPAQLEELAHLVKNGPVHDGDVISKDARGDLLTLRLASRALVKGQEGYTVANYVGAGVLRMVDEIDERSRHSDPTSPRFGQVIA